MEGDWLTDLALEGEARKKILEILAKTLVAEVTDLTFALYGGDRRKCWRDVDLMRRGGLIDVVVHPRNSRKRVVILTPRGAEALGRQECRIPPKPALVSRLRKAAHFVRILTVVGLDRIQSRTEFLETAKITAYTGLLDWYVTGPVNVAVYKEATTRVRTNVLAVDEAAVTTHYHIAVEEERLVRPRLTALFRRRSLDKRLLVVSEEDLGPCLETLLSPDGWPGPAAKALASILGETPELVPADRDHGIWSVPSLGRFLLDGRYNDVGAAWRARDSSYISESLLVFLSTDDMADWWWRRFPSAWVLLEDPPKILKPKTRRRSRTEEPSFAPRPDTPAGRIERYL